MSKNKGGALIGLRSDELAAKLDEIVAASGGKITKSDIIRAALEEKFARIEATGEIIPAVSSRPVAITAWRPDRADQGPSEYTKGLAAKVQGKASKSHARQ